MSTEINKQIALEIAHLLFVDIVGYSKLFINEQHAAVDELTPIADSRTIARQTLRLRANSVSR
jgi:hypothetical protein